MLITILISHHAGVFLVLLISITDSIYLGAQDQILTSSMLTGLAGVFFARNIRRRSNLLTAGGAVGLVGLGCTVLHAGLANLSLSTIIVHGVWAVLLGMGTAFVVGAVLPILEWMFDRITDISWLELTDLNHPLLRRLSMEAPGTFHHSLGVANLAESAASEIHGVNPTKCRVLSYFHDIGKLTKPDYFIENTTEDNNPHNEISPTMSALVIIAHVKEGVDRAIKHGLPRPVIDVIQQHHGTTLVYYFYRKALQQQEDAKKGSEILKSKQDTPEINESSFRYPGPIPQFKESGIISLADAIESSSRNLLHPTPQSIETLVNEIIEQKIEEGQLQDCRLTLREIRKAGDRFIFTLKNMLHARIEYPKEKDKDQQKEKSKERKGNGLQQTKALPLIDFPNS
jgi:putative nucleotidyltransferase with HDIG domain